VSQTPRSTIAIWLVAAVLGALAVMRLLEGGNSTSPPVRIDRDASAAGGPAGQGSPSPARAAIYVHVAGAVHRPGLIRLQQGSRVATALKSAGGPTAKADLTVVNLAAEVQDGQQILVPARGAVAAHGAAAPGAPAGIHLSTATAEQLDEVDGIGPTLAERIVEYRDEHGGFRSLDELSQVDGIGEKRLASLREQLQP
jgi:competence protein ComEA